MVGTLEDRMGYGRVDAPLGAYAVLTVVFLAVLVGAFAIAAARGSLTPDALPLRDLLLLGVATYKLSWLLTKDVITSVFRAPFTVFKGAYAPDEVHEAPRGRGFRRAIGELLTCPFCVGQWVAAFFVYGILLAPAVTRMVASIFVVLTVSDFVLATYPGLRMRLLQPGSERDSNERSDAADRHDRE